MPKQPILPDHVFVCLEDGANDGPWLNTQRKVEDYDFTQAPVRTIGRYKLERTITAKQKIHITQKEQKP